MKQGRRGKERVPTVKNPAYCRILYLLGDGEDTPYGLSKKYAGKSQPTLYVQCKLLFKEGFLLTGDRRNSFRVNFDKIVEEFLRFIEEEAAKSEEDVNIKKIVEDEKFRSVFLKSRVLYVFFKSLVMAMHNKFYDGSDNLPTLSVFFEKMVQGDLRIFTPVNAKVSERRVFLSEISLLVNLRHVFKELRKKNIKYNLKYYLKSVEKTFRRNIMLPS